MTLPAVVVVGGSYGAFAARVISGKLDPKKYQLILINPRPFSIHMLATARIAVSDAGKLEEQAMLPYDKLFVNGNGTFKQGKVIAIEKEKSGGFVTLDGGEKIAFHVLLLATGSIWDGVFSYPEDPEQVPQHIANNRAAFKAANSIAIVGGGAVGCELAGEIKDSYPKKKVTVVNGLAGILNDTYPDRFRRGVEKNLTDRGIELVLDDLVLDAPAFGSVEGLTTKKGKKIDADLVVAARGPRPNTAFIISSLGSDIADEKGFVKTSRTLQLTAHKDIFAIGDITNFPEQKTAAKATTHAKTAAANILTYLSSPSATLKEYKGDPEMLFLTNGKDRGQTYVGMLWGLHFGDWFTRIMKSKSLLIWMYKAGVGY